MIQSGDRTKFDVEVLKQLIKLLPEKHEVCLHPYLEAFSPTLCSMKGRLCSGKRLSHRVVLFRLKT